MNPTHLPAVKQIASKRCSRCRAVKSQAAFPANRSRPDGLGQRCSRCLIEVRRLAEYKEDLLEQAIYQRDPERLIERLERYRLDHADEFTAAAGSRGRYARRQGGAL